MSRVLPSLLWLPLVLAWGAVKALAVPAATVAVSWWLLPDQAAQVVTGLAVLYLAGVAWFAGHAVRARLRSLDRTVTIRRRDPWT